MFLSFVNIIMTIKEGALGFWDDVRDVAVGQEDDDVAGLELTFDTLPNDVVLP
jgi:hypothetical protein